MAIMDLSLPNRPLSESAFDEKRDDFAPSSFSCESAYLRDIDDSQENELGAKALVYHEMRFRKRSTELLYDEIRGLYVASTPEEHVRQEVLHKMVYALGFPKTLIAIEKELKELPHLAHTTPPHRRIDILCYGKKEHALYPLLLIECKAHAIDTAAKEQLIGYNSSVGAYFIALAAPGEVQFGYLDKKTARTVFHAGLPSYQELLAWIH